MLRWFERNFSKNGAVNSPALSECSLLIRVESFISKPSKDKLSKYAVIFSKAAQTFTDVLVLNNRTSIKRGKSGSLRAPTRK